MSNLVPLVTYVNSTMHAFFEELERRFDQTGEPCEFDMWPQIFAFDVIGEMAFSKPLGFCGEVKISTA